MNSRAESRIIADLAAVDLSSIDLGWTWAVGAIAGNRCIDDETAEYAMAMCREFRVLLCDSPSSVDASFGGDCRLEWTGKHGVEWVELLPCRSANTSRVRYKIVGRPPESTPPRGPRAAARWIYTSYLEVATCSLSSSRNGS